MKILVVNCGSSSLKYQFFDMETERVAAEGEVERIGYDNAIIGQEAEGREDYERTMPVKDHAEAVHHMFDLLQDPDYGVIQSLEEIDAVGHRVLHGGDKLIQSSLVTEEVLQAIRDNVKFGPLHNPAQLKGIEACEAVLGKEVPQVVVIDTAFHQTMPARNYIYPIPWKYYEEDGIRRYGFHGTSHRFIAQRASELLGIPLNQLNLISCHLGNGSSLCAIKNGKSFNTTMGLTPLAGLPMGTRSGDLDPAIVFYIMNKYGKTADEMDHILNKESGVLGISGTSSDFRDLQAEAKEGKERSQLALDIFYASVARTIGAYAVELGRVDGIVFTGGVGAGKASEYDRQQMCLGLEVIGAKLDPEKNRQKEPRNRRISTDDSRIPIWVIKTNEELMIARDTQAIVAE